MSRLGRGLFIVEYCSSSVRTTSHVVYNTFVARHLSNAIDVGILFVCLAVTFRKS